MRILAIDYGEKRVGIAISDEDQKIAFPLETFCFKKKNNFEEFWKFLTEIASKYQRKIMIIVGNPIWVNNCQSKTQMSALSFFNFLVNKKEFNVQMYDERFTTKIAVNYFRHFGIDSKKYKKLIDAVSAAIILQEYLDNCIQR